MTRFHFRGCPRCGGDLHLNQGDWQCLQCGRYPRPATAAAAALTLALTVQNPPPANADADADANRNAGANGFWDFWRRRAI